LRFADHPAGTRRADVLACCCRAGVGDIVAITAIINLSIFKASAEWKVKKLLESKFSLSEPEALNNYGASCI
jgi:hypothetical protein